MTTIALSALEALISTYGIDAVLKAMTAVADTKVHEAAVIHLDIPSAKRWADVATSTHSAGEAGY